MPCETYNDPSPPELDSEIPQWIQYLGLPGLVDVHVHFMPHNVMTKVWDYFETGGPMIGRKWPIRYRIAEEKRVALLRSFGVKYFTSLFYPHKPGMSEWLNSWSADFAARTPGCLRSATFFCEPSASDYVQREIEDGTQVFKAHLQVGGYNPLDRQLDAVWGALADSGTPVVVHCCAAPMPGAHTGLGPIAEVLTRHRRLRLIIAHFGQPEYEQFLDLALRYEDVYLDTTLVFSDFCAKIWPFPRDLIPRLADAADRILFGTDFPNIPDPYAAQIGGLARLNLGDDWLRQVCYGNAAKLFRLQ